MRKKLFIHIILIISIFLIGFFLASIYISYINNVSLVELSLKETTELVAGTYEKTKDIESIIQSCNKSRISLISEEGIVIADSMPLNKDNLENHLNRPEIQDAMLGIPKARIRYSNTLGVNMIYYAIKIDSDNSPAYIRVAFPVEMIEGYIKKTIPLLSFILMPALLASFLLAGKTSKTMVEPLLHIYDNLRHLTTLTGENKDTHIYPFTDSNKYEELLPIMSKINDISALLNANIQELEFENKKSNYILNNMADAIVVIDQNGRISFLNASAGRIFRTSDEIIGKQPTYLSSNIELTNALVDCRELGKDSVFESKIEERFYAVNIRLLRETCYCIAILSDITERIESSKRREEFFANASHELKTPLTAIRGFGELCSINNTSTILDKYITGIMRETDRMLKLIHDMLKLSELESQKQANISKIKVRDIINEIVDTLKAEMTSKEIICDVQGEAIINADPIHVYEVLKNVIENAVKYNKLKGFIKIDVNDSQDSTRISVEDGGIGISSKDQSRIFERFYRAEKSRSQKSGGTGLGLSIVKHICALYEWNIYLSSKASIGTRIEILINKQLATD